MRIALYSQQLETGTLEIAFRIIKKAREEEASVYVEEDVARLLRSLDAEAGEWVSIFQKSDNQRFDLMLTLGGDGTMLRAATYAAPLGIPLLGINTGRLGFLATVTNQNIESALIKIISGDYLVEKRSMLEVITESSISGLEKLNFALNEVAVSRRNTTSMISIRCNLDGDYMNTYWADGLIIATPTGSTGYSLSCGGPVISPHTHAFVITPIAPHNLGVRPLVVPDTCTIELQASGREPTHLLSLDSRIFTVSNDTILQIRKSDLILKMIKLPEDRFFQTLRKKMYWGEDKRN